MIKDKDESIAAFSDMSDAALFYLDESFRNARKLILSYIIGQIFSEKIKNITPNKSDTRLYANFYINNPFEVLTFNRNVISEETENILIKAYGESSKEAEIKIIKFKKSKDLKGVNLLGHITNFAFFIEVLMNRHLFVMNFKSQISNFEYNSLDKSSVLNKILYFFKEETKTNQMNPEPFMKLFRLRNLAVHFTRDNSKGLHCRIDELINLWAESSKLIKLIEQKEGMNNYNISETLNESVDDFINNFVFQRR